MQWSCRGKGPKKGVYAGQMGFRSLVRAQLEEQIFPLSNTKREYLRFVYISSGIQALSATVEVLHIHRRIKPEDGQVRDPSGDP